MNKITLTLSLIIYVSIALKAQSYTTFLSRLNGNERIIIKEANYGTDGSAYAVGTYSGQVNLNGNTFNSVNGEYDPFVAKIDSLGNWKWFIPIVETSASGTAYDVGVDAQNNVYVVGTCDSGATTLGTQVENGLFGVGRYNGFFLLKIQQTANNPSVGWFKGSNVTTLVNSEKAASLVIDTLNNVIVAAVHNSSGDYTPSFAGVAFVNNTADQAFVWKINSNGTVIKKWETSGDNFMNIHDMNIDKFGSILVTAAYKTSDGSCSLELGNTITNSFNRSTYGAPILIKLSDSLTTIWAKAEWTQYQQSYLYSLATDTLGNTFVISTYSDSVKIANNYFYANAGYLRQAVLYSYKADGTFNFIKKYTNSNTGDVEARNIACDKDNKMVMSADVYSTVATFSGIGINSRSFIARISTINGNVITSRVAVNQNITTPALAVGKYKVLLGGSNESSFGPLQFNNSNVLLPDFTNASELGYIAQFSDTVFLASFNENKLNYTDVKIFPNPAYENFNLIITSDLVGSFQMHIINSLGQRVMENKLMNKEYQMIDISRLKTGVYHIEIINANYNWQQPLYIIR